MVMEAGGQFICLEEAAVWNFRRINNFHQKVTFQRA